MKIFFLLLLISTAAFARPWDKCAGTNEDGIRYTITSNFSDFRQSELSISNSQGYRRSETVNRSDNEKGRKYEIFLIVGGVTLSIDGQSCNLLMDAEACSGTFTMINNDVKVKIPVVCKVNIPYTPARGTPCPRNAFSCH